MFEELEEINTRPRPFEFYTARELWTDDHTSKQMLALHLNAEIDVSSRNTAFVDRSAKWIASRFKVDTGTKIADFGCGPGLYSSRLADCGAAVTGIDFSINSIQYAREVASRKGLRIQYLNQDYLEFETHKRFNLILMIMCDFCALSPAQRERLLKKFFAILEPGGSVLLDVYSLSAYDRRKEEAMYAADLLDGFWAPNRYYGFLNIFKYQEEKVTLDKYTIVEPDRVRTVYNWLQYFSPEMLKKEFNACGFTVDTFYSDVAGKLFNRHSEEFAIVAARE